MAQVQGEELVVQRREQQRRGLAADPGEGQQRRGRPRGQVIG
jgi:hypothetical protein